ncbi:unnamed protein product [Cylicocyclus nassatus]|uniref:CUB domain-containing protein n=1 Tax=Cylicocyclus nassatus TaxID=53992 RepID=A0AA36DRV1_CYLNA|nr:unnamed protein product [Cylicocyclus nassatus]
MSAKGRRSMVPFDAGYVDTLGSHFLSFYDKLMMNMHYNCFEKCKTLTNEVVRHSPTTQCPEAFNNDPTSSSLSHCNERFYCDGLSGRNSSHAECETYGNAPLGSSFFGGSPFLASLFGGQGGWGWLGHNLPSIYGFFSRIPSTFGWCIDWESGSPSGCGRILQATTNYEHLEDTIGYPGVSNSSDAPDDFLKCHYWIQAPQGRRIEVVLVKYNDTVATDGCYLAGIEIKTQKDQRATGYRQDVTDDVAVRSKTYSRVCSPSYRGWVFRSESNVVPIITYSRVWPTEAVLRYRMGT